MPHFRFVARFLLHDALRGRPRGLSIFGFFFVSRAISNTCGVLYTATASNLTRFPLL